MTSVLCRRNKGNLLQIFLKGLYFSDRPKGLSTCLFICPVFQSCNKSDNVGNKIGTNKKNKSAFTCASNTCFRIISVVYFPKCFLSLWRWESITVKMFVVLCVLQILKSEDSLFECNYFIKEKINIIPKILNSPLKTPHRNNWFYQIFCIRVKVYLILK